MTNGLERVEAKVDKLQEDVYELKSDFKIHTALIQEHVAGDKKIINELAPVLEDFKKRQLQETLNKEKKDARYKSIKYWGKVVALVGGCATLLKSLV